MGAADLATATAPMEADRAEVARAGATALAGQAADLVLDLATARELVKVLVREAAALAAAALARRGLTQEPEVKVLRLGWERRALRHRDSMEVDRLARRAAGPSKAEPFKWALAQVERAAALEVSGLKAAHGILWEGAVAARRLIRTRADSGLRAKAQLLAVPVELVGAARAAELAWLARRRALELLAEVEGRAPVR